MSQTKEKILPTRRLKALVIGLGGISAAAKAWGIERMSLSRFLSGKTVPSLPTIERIRKASGLDYSAMLTKGER